MDRSLDDGPPDVQTFQLFLSAEWRAEFNKHNVVLTQPLSLSEFINNRRMQLQAQLSSAMNRPWTNGANNISAFSNGMVMGFQLSNLRKGGMSRLQAQKMRQSTRISSGLSIMGLQSYNVLPNERVIAAWKEMNNFLTNFIDNSFSHAGLKRIIREPSYYEKTFCAGPDLTLPEQPSILLTDRDLRYTNVLFLGNELDLLLFNIMTYSIFDLWFNNTMVSVLLCYLLNKLFVILRQGWSEVGVRVTFHGIACTIVVHHPLSLVVCCSDRRVSLRRLWWIVVS